VQPPAGRTVTPPGSSQSLYMPTDQQTLTDKLRTEAAGKEPTRHIDATAFSAPLLINPATGQATEIKLPEGVTRNEKAEKPEPYSYQYKDDNEGRVTVIRQKKTADSVPEAWGGPAKGWQPHDPTAQIGPQRKDPNAPPAERKATAAQLRAVVSKKAQSLRAAEAQFVKAHKTWDTMTDEEKGAAQDDLWKAKQAAETEYVDSLASYGVEAQPFDYAGQRAQLDAQRPAQPAPAGAAALPSQDRAATPAAPGKKSVSLAQLDAYVEEQRKTNPGFTKAEAVREAKRRGYSIAVGQ